MGLTVGVFCESGKRIESDNDLKLLLLHIREVDKLAKKRKLAPLEPFFLDGESAVVGEIEFLDPREAIETLEGLAKALAEKPELLPDGNEIEEEARELLLCLRRALKRNERCRLLFS
jgi:hypothetical protein